MSLANDLYETQNPEETVGINKKKRRKSCAPRRKKHKKYKACSGAQDYIYPHSYIQTTSYCEIEIKIENQDDYLAENIKTSNTIEFVTLDTANFYMQSFVSHFFPDYHWTLPEQEQVLPEKIIIKEEHESFAEPVVKDEFVSEYGEFWNYGYLCGYDFLYDSAF